MLAAGEAKPTQEADIYALDASLLIGVTGWRAAVANGRRRPVRAPGEMGELIDAMLSHAPEDRPTIHEVGKALSCTAGWNDVPVNRRAHRRPLSPVPG